MSKKIIQWNEEIPRPDEAVNNVIFVIVTQIGESRYLALGTGFVIGIENDNDEVIAISAAHVFEEIYRIQNPREPRPWRPFFVEELQKIDLSSNRVFGFIFSSGRGHILKFSSLFYDIQSDTAIFKVKKAKPDGRHIFTHNIRLDAAMPAVGTQVEGIGFKRMEFSTAKFGAEFAMVFRGCLTRRIGTITAVLDHMIKLKGPGAYVSFPIFGGMSGGPVLRVNTGEAPAAFAILSSDYTDTDEKKHDIYTAGMTTVAKLPLQWTSYPEGQSLDFNFISDDMGLGE